MKKRMICALMAICVILGLAACGKTEPRGLNDLDDMEQMLNDAYSKVLEDDADFEGVHDFAIEDVEEETHDQTFTCVVMPRENRMWEQHAIGLAKEGKVIQVQSVAMVDERLFGGLSEIQRELLVRTAFPVSNYKKDKDTIDELWQFLTNMETVNDGNGGMDKMRTVDGDIEYTFTAGSGGGIVLLTFTTRYLPAFSTGFFEDKD